MIKQEKWFSKLSAEQKATILLAIFSPNNNISQIAKQQKLSSTPLYNWQSSHIKSRLSEFPSNSVNSVNNFIALISADSKKMSLSPIKDQAKLSLVSFSTIKGLSLSLEGIISLNFLHRLLLILGQLC